MSQTCKLAILAPVGRLGQIAVQRHMEDLLPGRTVIIVRRTDPGWRTESPSLVLSTLFGGSESDLPVRAKRELEFSAVRKCLVQHNVKFILSEFLEFSVDFLPLATELNIPFFVHAHGHEFLPSLRDPSRVRRLASLQRANRIFVVSQFARHVLTQCAMDTANVSVVPSAFGCPSDPPKRLARGSVACLAVNDMVYEKGPMVTLDAFRRATEVWPTMNLECIGTGPLFHASVQLTRAFGLEGSVRFRGAETRETTVALMDNSDIFIHHPLTKSSNSMREGQLGVLLTAMSRALPVVTTTHGESPEVIEDGVSGFLVPEFKSEAMADRIVLLARDIQLRNRMGLAAFRQIKQSFTWQAEKDCLLELMGIS